MSLVNNIITTSNKDSGGIYYKEREINLLGKGVHRNQFSIIPITYIRTILRFANYKDTTVNISNLPPIWTRMSRMVEGNCILTAKWAY